MKKGFYILLLTLIAFVVMVVFPGQTFAQKEQIKIPVLVYHYFAKDIKEAQKFNSSAVVDIQNFLRRLPLHGMLDRRFSPEHLIGKVHMYQEYSLTDDK